MGAQSSQAFRRTQTGCWRAMCSGNNPLVQLTFYWEGSGVCQCMMHFEGACNACKGLILTAPFPLPPDTIYHSIPPPRYTYRLLVLVPTLHLFISLYELFPYSLYSLSLDEGSQTETFPSTDSAWPAAFLQRILFFATHIVVVKEGKTPRRIYPHTEQEACMRTTRWVYHVYVWVMSDCTDSDRTVQMQRTRTIWKAEPFSNFIIFMAQQIGFFNLEVMYSKPTAGLTFWCGTQGGLGCQRCWLWNEVLNASATCPLK